MTQGKKKKRAANRSIMLAKKIIIKDGGTVSWGTAPGRVFWGPDLFLPPTLKPAAAPGCPRSPSPLPRCRCLGLPGPQCLCSRGFPPSPRPAASGARPLEWRSRPPLPHLPAFPLAAPGGPAALSPRAPQPRGGIDAGLRCRPVRRVAGSPGRRVVAGSAVPFTSAASPAPSRPREAVAALWKQPGAIPALPYAANRVASGAATPLGPRSALAPFFHGVLGQCSCSWLRPVR